jgi:uncharacterized protein (DUF1778 family)
MTVHVKRTSRSAKLDLRLTPQAKQTLQAAAEYRQKSVTEFVLDSALVAAEDTLLEQRSIKLDAKQWANFIKALDAPPRQHPRLKRLLEEPSVFD